MIVSWSPWPSMPKPTDGLAGRGDAVRDLLGPAVLDADDDDRGDVRIAAGADQGAEVKVEVGAELQPPVRMRDRQRALDVVRDRLGGGVRQVVERQDDDEVADADAAVLAPIAEECGVLRDDGHGAFLFLPALGLDVVDVGVLAAPDRRDHLAHVDAVLDDGVAGAMSLRATLWPIGMSWRASRAIVRSSSMTQPVIAVPAVTPSTTTTATVSPASCNTQWIKAGSWLEDRLDASGHPL
jgi:hypothetical protein